EGRELVRAGMAVFVDLMQALADTPDLQRAGVRPPTRELGIIVFGGLRELIATALGEGRGPGALLGPGRGAGSARRAPPARRGARAPGAWGGSRRARPRGRPRDSGEQPAVVGQLVGPAGVGTLEVGEVVADVGDDREAELLGDPDAVARLLVDQVLAGLAAEDP